LAPHPVLNYFSFFGSEEVGELFRSLLGVPIFDAGVKEIPFAAAASNKNKVIKF
jgi:hypothetical protein